MPKPQRGRVLSGSWCWVSRSPLLTWPSCRGVRGCVSKVMETLHRCFRFQAVQASSWMDVYKRISLVMSSCSISGLTTGSGKIISPADLALFSLFFNTHLAHHLFWPPSLVQCTCCFLEHLCPCACTHWAAVVFEAQGYVLGKQGWGAIVSGSSSQFLVNR